MREKLHFCALSTSDRYMTHSISTNHVITQHIHTENTDNYSGPCYNRNQIFLIFSSFLHILLILPSSISQKFLNSSQRSSHRFHSNFCSKLILKFSLQFSHLSLFKVIFIDLLLNFTLKVGVSQIFVKLWIIFKNFIVFIFYLNCNRFFCTQWLLYNNNNITIAKDMFNFHTGTPYLIVSRVILLNCTVIVLSKLLLHL